MNLLENSFGNAPYVCGDAVWEEAGEDAEQIVNEINAVSPHMIFFHAIHSTPGKISGRAQTDAECRGLWFGVGSENTFVNGKKKISGNL